MVLYLALNSSLFLAWMAFLHWLWTKGCFGSVSVVIWNSHEWLSFPFLSILPILLCWTGLADGEKEEFKKRLQKMWECMFAWENVCMYILISALYGFPSIQFCVRISAPDSIFLPVFFVNSMACLCLFSRHVYNFHLTIIHSSTHSSLHIPSIPVCTHIALITITQIFSYFFPFYVKAVISLWYITHSFRFRYITPVCAFDVSRLGYWQGTLLNIFGIWWIIHHTVACYHYRHCRYLSLSLSFSDEQARLMLLLGDEF